MYVAPPHRVDEAAAFDIAARARLGLLVTTGPEGLFASHLPLLVDPERRVLTGHLARANPHRDRAGDGEALVVFTGSEAYVSPGFYPSKQEHGRVVPTWNYEAAQVHGRLTWFEDPAELLRVVRALTDRHEAGRPAPWSVDDAPPDYLDGLLRGFVGVRLEITRVAGKAKLNQTSSPADHAGAVAGLGASSDPLDRAVAARMRRD